MPTRRMFRGLAAAASVVCIVWGLNGCAANTEFYDPVSFGVSASDLTLSVVNRNFEDVRVYMLRETVSIPLGTVESMGSRVFKISATKLGVRRVLSLMMVTSPSRTGITMIPVDVEPGQVVEARLGTFLNNSNVFVR